MRDAVGGRALADAEIARVVNRPSAFRRGRPTRRRGMPAKS